MGAAGVKHVSQPAAKSYEINEERQAQCGLLLWATGRVWGSMPLDRKRFFVALTIERHWPGEFRPLSPLG
jgi:hypothetical protein